MAKEKSCRYKVDGLDRLVNRNKALKYEKGGRKISMVQGSA